MSSSDFWDNPNSNDISHEYSDDYQRAGVSSSLNSSATPLHHQLQTQGIIPQEELMDSIASGSNSENNFLDDVDDGDLGDEMVSNMASNLSTADQPTLEQIQRVYYSKGLEELESLRLLDLSPLANWKLSSFKQGFGLPQLRDDSPETFWQSDGSNGNNNSNNNTITNNQLSNPHSVTIQFSKKVCLERISIFTNFSLDESYTPSRIKIMAGSSDGWDLSEVCVVNFNKPMGWSHIIFNRIRNDGVLKCFMVKLIILANHQDGKDSHIRAIRCFGKKSVTKKPTTLHSSNDILNNLSSISRFSNLSGLSLNDQIFNSHDESTHGTSDNFSGEIPPHQEDEEEDIEEENVTQEQPIGKDTSKILDNVAGVIGFNTGFSSLELKSTSSIR